MHCFTLKTISLIALVCLAAACGDDDSSADAGTNNSGTNNSGGGLPTITAIASFMASDFGSSSFGGVTPGLEEITTTSFGNGDIVVAAGAGRAYAVNRPTGVLEVLDPSAGFATTHTLETQGPDTGPYATNPQTVIEAAGSLWVPTPGMRDVVRFVEMGDSYGPAERLDVADTFTDDNDSGPYPNPDPGPAIASGDTVLVGLQYLDETFTAARNGALLLIDAVSGDFIDADQTSEEIDPLALPLRNPTVFSSSPTGAIGVGLVGTFGAADGGIVLVSPDGEGGFAVGAMIATEEELGGDLADFVLIDDASGFAIVSALDFSGSSLVFFDASGVTPIDDVADPAGLAITGDRGFVLVGDRGEGGGVILLHAETLEVLWGPIAADLPPSSLAIVE